MILPNVAGRIEPSARSAGSDACVARNQAALLKPTVGRGHTREQTRRPSRPAFRRDAKSPHRPQPVKVEADDVAARERSREQAGPLSVARLPLGDAVPQRVCRKAFAKCPRRSPRSRSQRDKMARFGRPDTALPEGWAKALAEGWSRPLYWETRDGQHWTTTLRGSQLINRPASRACLLLRG
jgi:hypothetical protein